jgi:hypothetical protein
VNNFAIHPLRRHPELVSGSIGQTARSVPTEAWILKRVQDDDTQVQDDDIRVQDGGIEVQDDELKTGGPA